MIKQSTKNANNENRENVKFFLGTFEKHLNPSSLSNSLHIRLSELLNDLVIAKGEGTYKKLIKSYQKVNLLILDEWILKPLSTDQAMELR